VQILSESGVVPLVATNLLSDHYNKTRNNYYLALDAAQRDVGAFVSYALKGFVDELREQIAEVRRHNIQVMWESFIFEKFREQPSTTARDRQRDVVLHMDPSRTYTPEQITELNSRLIRLYGQNGERTPARDMNELVKMGLVERVGRREYRALRRIIQAFIPPIAT
jgi:Fic family protein